MILMIIAVALLGDVYDDITVTRNPDPDYVAGTYEE